ncbi:hypothetical protein PR048_012635 [Dryococelus australis]|uniref:Uncharacterized protein n=1 Tax=Dryococelus australis TaxID=614101 RepID=A0ABQ9HPX3_9NEOP|nr:hypothetical protein PR048_012635 [Dryococelus australis]
MEMQRSKEDSLSTSIYLLIFDAVSTAGSQQKVIISRALIHSARNAHDRYIEALEEKTLSLNAEEKSTKEKRKLALQVEELKQKKKKNYGRGLKDCFSYR